VGIGEQSFEAPVGLGFGPTAAFPASVSLLRHVRMVASTVGVSNDGFT